MSLQKAIFVWTISSVECVALEYVLDFELRRSTSSGSFET